MRKSFFLLYTVIYGFEEMGVRRYRCKKCGAAIGYKRWRCRPVWFEMAIPKKRMCDRCVLERMKERGEDTTFFERTIYAGPFQGILDETSGKRDDRHKDR